MTTNPSTRTARPFTRALAAALALSLAAAAYADEGNHEPNTGNVSVAAGADVTSAYFFRGINQEDTSFIFQPYAELTLALPDTTEMLTNTSLTFGIWNSFHEAKSLASGIGSEPDSWYESDLYVTLAADLTENCSATLTYTAYTSPNDAFATVQEIAVGLAFNDADLWGDNSAKDCGFEGLQPSLTIATELNNSAFGPDEGVYLELGIEPGVNLATDTNPARLTFPVTVGLSLSDYYETATDDDSFGYVDAGVALSVLLSQVPAEYGNWSLNLALHVLFLGDSLEAANNGDDVDVLGSVGFSFEY